MHFLAKAMCRECQGEISYAGSTAEEAGEKMFGHLVRESHTIEGDIQVVECPSVGDLGVEIDGWQHVAF